MDVEVICDIFVLKVRMFREMIINMSEHSLIGKYSLIRFRTLILYVIIDRRHIVTVNLSYLLLFHYYLFKRLLRRKFIRLYDRTKPILVT